MNKAGKSGYSPACQNEWTSVCRKPHIKCSDCTHRAFENVTDEIIAQHLNAKTNRTVGVYPLLQDETCWFLAIDFDKRNWQQDAAAVIETCKQWLIPASLERSRSGNGGHVWLFFNQPIEARMARKLGCAILTKTMEKRYQISLESYDRLFPNQDTLPKGGFGNLISLPLQGIPRREGNSVFVDETFRAYDDQWRYLSGVEKLSLDQVERLIHDLTKGESPLVVGPWNDRDDEHPWITAKPIKQSNLISDHLPSYVNVVISNMIYIEKKDLPSAFIHCLQSLATFQNPDFYKAQAMRLSTYGKPRVIGCYENFTNYIAIPRGCLEMMIDVMSTNRVEREALRQKIARIPDSEERVLIATGKLIGEGFDDARLDTLFLVHPVSWKGTLQQYAGRLHRTHQSKHDVHYVDLQVPLLTAMYKKRIKGYQVMGYHGMNL